MDDIGHVGLVDAHAKGIGRHHDALAVIEKIFLRSLTGLGIQSGVIACRSKAPTVQNAVHVIDQLAGQAIDDATLLSSSGQFRDQCRPLISWMVDKKAQIRTVKAGYQQKRVLQTEQPDDIPAHPLGGRRRERTDRRSFGQNL